MVTVLRDTFGVIQCVLFLLTNCLKGTGLILNDKIDCIRQDEDNTRLDLVTNIPPPNEGLYMVSFSYIYTFLFFPLALPQTLVTHPFIIQVLEIVL